MTLPEDQPRAEGPRRGLWFGDVLVVFLPLFAAFLAFVLLVRGPHLTLVGSIACAAALAALITAAWFTTYGLFVHHGVGAKHGDDD